ncbi:zinc finger protein 449-like [Manis javanica]|uniref:zinc finger protein 449-like n=1 Tax=Manis javanica TaxID=9974 RepID=UPI003C6D6EA9
MATQRNKLELRLQAPDKSSTVGRDMAVPLDSAVQNLNQGSVFHEYDTDREVSRQRFRQFQYKEAAGPRDAFKKLLELCRQWLKPNTGCLEQILEVLVLEQLMQILPIEIQNSMRPFSMKNREAVLALMEFLQTKTDVSEEQVDRQEVLLEELAPVGTVHIPPNIHLESPPVQVMGPAPEAPVAEVCIPQGGPQELSYGAAGECQPFLDPELQGCARLGWLTNTTYVMEMDPLC